MSERLTVKSFKMFLDQYPDDTKVWLLGVLEDKDVDLGFYIDKFRFEYEDNTLLLEGDLENFD